MKQPVEPRVEVNFRRLVATVLARILTLALPFGIINGMKDTLILDKAGRMVLPQSVRKQFGLRTGSALDLRITADAIILYPVEAKPSLTQEGGLYVHEGRPDDSLLAVVESVRSERSRSVWGGSR